MKRIGDDRCTVRDYVELAITLAFAYIIIISGVRVAMVIGPSMQPTLEDHSIHILVPVQDPKIGDIVAFQRPSQKDSYIKRIVAGPGDTVDHWGTAITLGDDEYYVLGDNRENSRDSRSFGPIDGDTVPRRNCLKGSSTLFTQPPAAAASSTMEAKGSHHARRSD